MPALAPPAAVPPPPAVRYGFRKAQIGMELAAWRASAPHRQAARCSAERPRVETCRVVDQPLGGSYRVRDLTSTFVDGRLARVSFTTSVDGFAFATAELKRAFGAPSEIWRDRVKLQNGFELPHVQMVWRNGRSTIQLDDPTRSGGRLSVTISDDARAGDLAASSSDAPRQS